MKIVLGAAIVVTLIGSGIARAQAPAPAPASYYSGANSIYGAPGFYGTSYGVASYGVPRTFSSYNSPYGAGYGGGYPPTAFLPGKYGVGLWRPGFVAPGYMYGSANGYRTFPAQSWPSPRVYGPPFGVYAPAFGPMYAPGW